MRPILQRGGGTPLAARGLSLDEAVREAGAHVVQKQIRVRADGLPSYFGQRCERRRGELADVARLAPDVSKDRLPRNDRRVIEVTLRRNAEECDIKDQIL